MTETAHVARFRPRRLRRLRASVVDVLSLRTVGRRRRLRAERRAADEEILQSPWVSPLLQWRVNELIERGNRYELARSLRDAVKTADARYLPNASPINRRAARVHSRQLLELARRLEDGGPVAPQGVLLVERLLVDGFGPLYSREQADALPTYLGVARAALEPHRW